MEITEKDLEDLIFDALRDSPMDLVVSGLPLRLVVEPTHNRVHWMRQVELKQYGRADIIGYGRFKGKIRVDIVELKNVPITCEDFNQLFRYKTAVVELLANNFKGHTPDVMCYLVGPSIKDGHFILNEARCHYYKFDFTLRGFKFKMQNEWVRSGGVFPIKEVHAHDYITWPETSTLNKQQEEPVNG